MPNPFFDHPILNSPYERPPRHWELDENGQPTQQIIEEAQRLCQTRGDCFRRISALAWAAIRGVSEGALGRVPGTIGWVRRQCLVWGVLQKME
jgi:hypothetical protein